MQYLLAILAMDFADDADHGGATICAHSATARIVQFQSSSSPDDASKHAERNEKAAEETVKLATMF